MENTPAEQQLNIDPGMKTDLESTRRWAGFMAIVGFVFLGLIVLMGLLVGPLVSLFSGDSGLTTWPLFLGGFIYILIALIYFFPILFLYRFSRYTRRGLQENDQKAMGQAFRNLKSHYTFIGILMALALGMYLVFGVAALLITHLS